METIWHFANVQRNSHRNLTQASGVDGPSSAGARGHAGAR
jgi:hypothetical protein